MNEHTIIRVKKSPIVHSDGFERAYSILTPTELTQFRTNVMKRTGMSPSALHYKRLGQSPVRQDEWDVICEEFAQFGVNASTGERL